MPPFAINAERLHQRLADLAQIGALPDGGVCRLAFSPEDKAGRDWVMARMQALGLAIHIDGIGNVLGIRAGQTDGPLVLTGSHTDTVATGGRYDGSLGVVAGLEALETLVEAGHMTQLPLGVLSFANEEGARFMPDMMGSLVMRGDTAPDALRSIVGNDGTTIGENLDALGFAGTADFRTLALKAFIELHIEQGPILEQEGVTIGAVAGVQGIRWIQFTLGGASAHAGATPIAMRRDAGYVAGAIVQFARHLSNEMGGGQRATVGAMRFRPNIVNVVAEQAVLTVDLRNPDAARLDEAEARLMRFVQETAEAEGVTVAFEKTVDVAPVQFDAALVATIEKAAKQHGYAVRRLISGAGHDAQILASRWPAAMIFVPSQGGISHNIHEYTAPADLAAGANVLLHTLLDLAK